MPKLLFLCLAGTLAGQGRVDSGMTVFLHAAPLNPGLLKMQASDVEGALSSLKKLLNYFPNRSVRLVVFSLQQGQEFYRKDSFTASGMDAVSQILSGLQLGTVDYHSLQNQKPVFLSELLHREFRETNRSGTIIFLGPDVSEKGDTSVATPERAPPGQHVFYLKYQMDGPSGERPLPRHTTDPEPRPLAPCQGGSLYGCNNGGNSATSPERPPLDVMLENQVPQAKAPPDAEAIARAMHKMKAKTFVIRNPGDFATALEKIDRF